MICSLPLVFIYGACYVSFLFGSVFEFRTLGAVINVEVSLSSLQCPVSLQCIICTRRFGYNDRACDGAFLFGPVLVRI